MYGCRIWFSSRVFVVKFSNSLFVSNFRQATQVRREQQRRLSGYGELSLAARVDEYEVKDESEPVK